MPATTIDADSAQVSYCEATSGLRNRVDVTVSIDGGEQVIHIINLKQLNLDGVWVHTQS